VETLREMSTLITGSEHDDGEVKVTFCLDFIDMHGINHLGLM